MNEALVIIDMQTFYDPSPIVLENVINNIRKFRKMGKLIIIVGFHATLFCNGIIQALSNYHNCRFIFKHTAGGGDKIFNIIHDTDIDTITVCGISTNCCVRETVQQLNGIGLWGINVLENVCGGSTKRQHRAGIRSMAKLENVVILEE